MDLRPSPTFPRKSVFEPIEHWLHPRSVRQSPSGWTYSHELYRLITESFQTTDRLFSSTSTRLDACRFNSVDVPIATLTERTLRRGRLTTKRRSGTYGIHGDLPLVIQQKETTMKLATITLATAFALSSTFALAQAGGASASGAGGASAGSAATGSATGSTSSGGTTGTAGASATSPNNTQSPSGNTLGPKASPSGSTMTPTGPGSGLSK